MNDSFIQDWQDALKIVNTLRFEYTLINTNKFAWSKLYNARTHIENVMSEYQESYFQDENK